VGSGFLTRSVRAIDPVQLSERFVRVYLFTAPGVGGRGGQAMISWCRAGGGRPREG